MINRRLKVSLIMLLTLVFSIGNAQDNYELGNSSKRYDGIPKGTIKKFSWESTIVYPNTVRDYYVYVPEQYNDATPAALMVFQDGHAYVKEDGNYRVPIVFDNLISQGKIPVTIGLFVNPGHDKDADEPTSPFRVTNRSIEYDEVSGDYGKFLLEELIPELKKSYNISDDPKMNAICGLSSGGICAFSAAWFYPDKFNKVLSHIGSFTDIRGGHNYPSMIRKNDPKNIKVFLQDGSNDLNNDYGDWWLSNLQMKSALEYKGYNYKFVGGTGEHNGAHGGSILPESLTWLWEDVVAKQVAGGVYKFSENTTLASGESYHYSHMNLETKTLTSSGSLELTSSKDEQMIIIKEGEVKVSFGKKQKTIGANSVFVLLPGDKGTIQSISPEAVFYRVNYISKKPQDNKRGKKNGGSFVIDFDELEYKEHDRGGVRKYFRKATTMCPYYEMHVTNLNPGIQSHAPHTHNASEFLIMIDGETEMEIGNAVFNAKPGDVYFAPANVSHAIKSTGSKQAIYFAYQWE
ncbi:MAG: cupin domain-containing protein [Flammeovirgaceae bacterium]|nr:cupin domain-containing protein [Flammeovirgaceae bacterium]